MNVASGNNPMPAKAPEVRGLNLDPRTRRLLAIPKISIDFKIGPVIMSKWADALRLLGNARPETGRPHDFIQQI